MFIIFQYSRKIVSRLSRAVYYANIIFNLFFIFCPQWKCLLYKRILLKEIISQLLRAYANHFLYKKKMQWVFYFFHFIFLINKKLSFFIIVIALLCSFARTHNSRISFSFFFLQRKGIFTRKHVTVWRKKVFENRIFFPFLTKVRIIKLRKLMAACQFFSSIFFSNILRLG